MAYPFERTLRSLSYESGTRHPTHAVLHLSEPDGSPLDIEVDTLNLDPVLLEPAQAKTFLQQETQRYGALVEKSGLEKQ